jgi:hypothetical protein
MEGEGVTFCRIETASGNAIVIAFDHPRCNASLRAIAMLRRFDLIIEGMMPVVIVFPPDRLT